MTTATYDRSGIQFIYPENWQVTDDTEDVIPRTIVLESPTSAFWSIDIHPFSVGTDELLETFVQAMNEEYPDIESQLVKETIEGREAVGYDLTFYCLDFVVATKVRAFQEGHATYLLTYQGEDRDFEKLEIVFQAITHSLLQDHPQ